MHDSWRVLSLNKSALGDDVSVSVTKLTRQLDWLTLGSIQSCRGEKWAGDISRPKWGWEIKLSFSRTRWYIILSALQRPRSPVTKWAWAVFKLQHRCAEVSTRIHPWRSDGNVFNPPSIRLKGSSTWQSETEYSVEMLPTGACDRSTPCAKQQDKNESEKVTKDIREDVFFHHSDPSDSSIHPLSDRGYFLWPKSVSVPLKLSNVHIQASPQEKKTFLGKALATAKWSFQLLFMLLHGTLPWLADHGPCWTKQTFVHLGGQPVSRHE